LKRGRAEGGSKGGGVKLGPVQKISEKENQAGNFLQKGAELTTVNGITGKKQRRGNDKKEGTGKKGPREMVGVEKKKKEPFGPETEGGYFFGRRGEGPGGKKNNKDEIKK